MRRVFGTRRSLGESSHVLQGVDVVESGQKLICAVTECRGSDKTRLFAKLFVCHRNGLTARGVYNAVPEIVSTPGPDSDQGSVPGNARVECGMHLAA